MSTESPTPALLSMTGFGEARVQDDRWTVVAELRTVNNRHFKMIARISEPYGGLEAELEPLVRGTVRRGTVALTLRVDRPRRAEDYRINTVALASYRDQLRAFEDHPGRGVDLAALLALPGVVEEARPSDETPRDDWPALTSIVAQALARLQEARAEEGRAMAAELLALGATISGHLERIAARAPAVIEAYRDRLLERVGALIADRGVTLEPKDLIREVAIVAERGDIAEEVVRLRAHLDQYAATLRAPEGGGRKLEFIVQEMGRETNTIGSKANDVEISRDVVEIKGTLEKIRELIQNVE